MGRPLLFPNIRETEERDVPRKSRRLRPLTGQCNVLPATLQNLLLVKLRLVPISSLFENNRITCRKALYCSTLPKGRRRRRYPDGYANSDHMRRVHVEVRG
jgi:hypothetical protein